MRLRCRRLSRVVGLLLLVRAPTARPEPPYRVVHGWPVVPDNTVLDEVSAVAVDSRGDVFVLTRAGRKWPDSDVLDETPIPKPTVFLFDGRSGQPLARWGESMFALPHSVTVDAADNVWVADVALHQVFKLSHDGKVLLALGERGKPGRDRAHFNRPSDVAVAADGSIYVSDGYGNSRIVKLAPDGSFLLEWGTKGKEPGQLDLPHALALDRAGRVYVADRGNARIQVFDKDGSFLEAWKGPPFVSPQDVKVGPDGTALVAEAGNDTPPDRSGILVLRADGSVSERVGRFGNYDGQFLDPHWVALGHGGELYVADFGGRRVQKFVRNVPTSAEIPAMAKTNIGARVDHLLLGVADLDRGIEELTAATGLAPLYGGKHPRGTHNALLSLGDHTYLELIAVQPGAAPPAGMSDLSRLARATPIGWAVSAPDADALRRGLEPAGFALAAAQPGGRVTPSGAKLLWRTLDLATAIRGAPFFIVWAEGTPHPSATSPAGCTLGGFRVASPDDDALRRLVSALDLKVDVARAAGASYSLTLECPKGRVELTGP